MDKITTLKFSCVFCGASTNFEDKEKAYCIDCYVKLRNSAHTHKDLESLPVNPTPLTPVIGVPPVTVTPGFPDIGTYTVGLIC